MTDWHAIVTEHGPAVWRTVYRLTGDEDLARDCYQDTFLAGFRAEQAGPIDCWSALLRTLATRRAIDAVRARMRQRGRINPGVDPSHLSDATGRGRRSPAAHEAHAHQEELIQAVRDVLAQINPRQAQAFALRHFEQMSNTQIAARLGTTPRNVDVLVHRAAARLRAKLPRSVRSEYLPATGASG